jgi:hypothetical protein
LLDPATRIVVPDTLASVYRYVWLKKWQERIVCKASSGGSNYKKRGVRLLPCVVKNGREAGIAVLASETSTAYGDRREDGEFTLEAGARNVASLDRYWRLEDIGLFYPDYRTCDKTRPTVEADSKTYIRDVHYFVAHAEDLLGRKDELVVRLNISSCLRGEAQTWYVSLSELERDRLQRSSCLRGEV